MFSFSLISIIALYFCFEQARTLSFKFRGLLATYTYQYTDFKSQEVDISLDISYNLVFFTENIHQVPRTDFDETLQVCEATKNKSIAFTISSTSEI